MTLTVGGRDFSPVDFDRRTVAWQVHVDRLVGDAGLDRMAPLESEDPIHYLARLHQALMRSGKACELLGCFLIPAGMTLREWSTDVADETARHLQQCEDVETVYGLAGEFLLGFFKRQFLSLQSSLNSFGARQTAASDNSAPH